MSTCGTHAAYFAHHRRSEEPCDSCKAAHANWQRNRRRTKGLVQDFACGGGCGAPVRKSRAGGPGTCRKCLSRLRKPGQVSRRRYLALVKRDLAARGTQSRAPWVQGECANCGDYFLRRRAASPYCSKRCGSSARREWISRADRLAIYERDEWTCQVCAGVVDPNLPMLDDWAPTLDHITPRSRGGSDDPENLRLAHRWCNSVLGDGSFYTLADLAAA